MWYCVAPLAFSVLRHKTLLMLFEKPSLRTRVSLETGMTQLGGHAIAYMTGDSPVGKKETYEDTGAVRAPVCKGFHLLAMMLIMHYQSLSCA
jgi:ornithine carbamoyltransferase